MTQQRYLDSSQNSERWHTISARIRKSDLFILNKKLEMNGFKTFNEFVHAWIKGDYPAHENNEQVERLLSRLRDKGIVNPLTGEFSPTFYRSVDSEDMLKGLSKRYVYPKHAKDLISYFELYAEIFFTKPQLIRDETGHKRAWICDSMRRFGEYYDRKFHNPELKLLIQEIIERYELNRKMKIHDRVWMSDEDYIKKMVSVALNVDGELGILIKFALYSGLRGGDFVCS